MSMVEGAVSAAPFVIGLRDAETAGVDWSELTYRTAAKLGQSTVKMSRAEINRQAEHIAGTWKKYNDDPTPGRQHTVGRGAHVSLKAETRYRDWTCESAHTEQSVWLGRTVMQCHSVKPNWAAVCLLRRKPAQQPKRVDCPGHRGGSRHSAFEAVPATVLWHLFPSAYPKKQGMWRTNGMAAHSEWTSTGRLKKRPRKAWKLPKGNLRRGWGEHAWDDYALGVGASKYSKYRCRKDAAALGLDKLDLAGLERAMKDGRLKAGDLNRRYWQGQEPNMCWEQFTRQPRNTRPEDREDDEADHGEPKPIYSGKRSLSERDNTMPPDTWNVSASWMSQGQFLPGIEWSKANTHCYVCGSRLPEPHGKRKYCPGECEREGNNDVRRLNRRRRYPVVRCWRDPRQAEELTPLYLDVRRQSGVLTSLPWSSESKVWGIVNKTVTKIPA